MIDNFPKRYFDTPDFEIRDITEFFGPFVEEFFSLISTLFNLLDSITILGVGLLNILVSFFIIGLVVPIILSLVRSRSIEVGRYKRYEKRIEKKRHQEAVERWNAV